MPHNQPQRWPPRGAAGWLVRRVVKPGEDPRSQFGRTQLGMLEGWTSAALSVVLAFTKLGLGWFTGSIAVIADGVNNLTDIGSSLVIALGFRWSRKPRDPEHPFGHGRIETVATLVLSITLIMVALDVGKESVQRLLRPEALASPPWVIALLAVTIAVKEWLAFFARSLAKATESKVLEADSWNHQYDVLSTLVVVLALIGSRFGWHTLDGWAGLVVSLFILWTGIRYARESISTLLGEAATADEVKAVLATASKVPGVRGVHDILLHRYGDMKLVSFHIEVDAARSALDVHNLAERVEREVERSTASKAIVHVDPVDRKHPMYRKADDVLKGVIAKDNRIAGFHDLRATGKGKGVEVSVDIVVSLKVGEGEYAAIREAVEGHLRAQLESVGKVSVVIEPAYSDETRL